MSSAPMPSSLPPVERVGATLALGDTEVALETRALVVAVVPVPTWGREAEVLAGVFAAANAGADVVEVPGEPRLLGPAASSAEIPIAARVTSAAAAAAAEAAGAGLLLVPVEHLAEVVDAQADEGALRDDRTPRLPPYSVAVLVGDAHSALVAGEREDMSRPVALDAVGRSGVDLVTEVALALAVGARLVRTSDVRQARRVVEVMAALLEARR